MSQKKLSEKTYRLLETEGTHIAESRETKGANRGLEFDDATNKLIGPVELVEISDTHPRTYSEFSPWEQLVIDVAAIIVPRVTEYLTDVAISSFDRWWQNRKMKAVPKKASQSILKQKTKAQQIVESSGLKPSATKLANASTQDVLGTEFDVIYKAYQTNMSCAELQKELIDIFVLSIIRAKKIWKVTHANITDASISELELKTQIERLCDTEVLDNINLLIGSHLDLLDEWETIVLSELMGRGITENGHYIPIERTKIKQALLPLQNYSEV